MGPAEAVGRFEGLADVAPDAMVGHWRGETLATGHPFDGLLEALGWWGKQVEGPERVHPLLFRLHSGVVAPLEPAVMPTAFALALPGLARSTTMRLAFQVMAPLLVARRPGARLERRGFRGRTGTALCYLRQPITDHLRRVDDRRVIGLMERRGMAPFLFLLTRSDVP